MTTANEYFYKAYPDIEMRSKRVRDVLKKARRHHHKIVKRLENKFSETLYNRTYECLALEGRLGRELSKIETQFEDFCRNTLKLY